MATVATVPRVAGLLLAAGAGRRMGRPKALVRGADGVPWVSRSLQVLREGGCHPVLVVVGAAADEVTALVGDGAEPVRADDWQEGMGASLGAGLRALLEPGRAPVEAAVVLLVDLPGVGVAVVRRLLAAGGAADDALVRAAYDGRPGHPVLIGARHWPGVLASAAGDVGARDYLRDHDVQLVECGDIADGADIDTPEGVR